MPKKKDGRMKIWVEEVNKWRGFESNVSGSSR